jgi:2-octaprenyl-6-methoxyphenol hydroxylase
VARRRRGGDADQKIHVSDQGHFGFARIDAEAQGLDAMGYVLPNRALGRALWERIERTPAIRVFCPAQVLEVEPGEPLVGLELGERGGAAFAAGAARRRRRRHAVGGAPRVRRRGREPRLRQTAVITTVLPQRFHDHVAYERFTESGPLALLPLATAMHAGADGGRADGDDPRWRGTDAEFLAEAAAPLRISARALSQGGPPRRRIRSR